MLRSFIACIVLVAFSTIAIAQTTPDTAPATQSTATPKSCYKRLATAMDEGDADTVRSLIHVDNPVEERIAEVFIDFVKANGRLRRAAIAQFGMEGSRALINDPATTAENMARIDGAVETIDGEVATLTINGNDGGAITLRRVGDQWKLPMAALRGNVTEAELEPRLAEMAHQSKLLEETAAEIEADKYRTLEEAMHRLRARMMEEPGATTQKAE